MRVYSHHKFRFRNVFSNVAADHIARPRNVGPLVGATHVGAGGIPGDGPYVRMWLVIENGQVLSASYECNGCPSSTVAGSMLTQVAIGREVERLETMTPQDLLTLVGGLPEGKGYYADLAVSALLNALATPVKSKCN